MADQNTRASANAQKVALRRDLAAASDTAHLDLWAALVFKQRRRLGNVLYDCSFVVMGWVMLIGMIQYPIAHLIGLVVCSLALLASVENGSQHYGRLERSRELSHPARSVEINS